MCSKQSCCEMGRKMGQKQSCEISHGGNERLRHCLKPIACLILKHTHTCSAHHVYICFQIKATSLCFHMDMAAVSMKI